MSAGKRPTSGPAARQPTPRVGRLGTWKPLKEKEVLGVSSLGAVAAAFAALALVAWTPAVHAGARFSFSISGGDQLTRGHVYGKHYGHRPGRGHLIHRYYFGHPGRYRYRPYRPHWHPENRYRSYRHYRLPAPRCILSNGYWYCR
jgi:hypothetical protein